MRAITDTFIAYKLVWLRVLCYFLLPFGTAFMIATETWSGATWDATHPFLKVRLFAGCFIAGLVSFVAFMDSSMQRAGVVANELKEKRETETSFLKKNG